MAAEWIKLEHATPGKQEMYRLARLLGVSRGDAFLLAVEWWIWLDRQTRNGLVTEMYADQVDDMMRCPGFAMAMKAVNWLDVGPDGQIGQTPNFDRHNGKTAKDRAVTKDRVSDFREKHKQTGNDSRNGAFVTTPLPEVEVEVETSKASSAAPPGFVQFWTTWPAGDRKTAKAKCFDIWKRRHLERLTDKIVGHVAAMRESKQWRDGYDPAPLTYLNQSRWEDGMPVASAAEGGRKWQ